ncbi:hypothetical protein BDV96DRAFT_576766 [Lophiotrema nucula]|uniref:Uncharacterized protein n=1 Tax=Lophiotrema nucula TaxID=690887 RepID=A0A6A5Z7S6_9PLEO|nr:hypothetical protein BDV96DRAFT_576766 [Lophiotrema nucula]
MSQPNLTTGGLNILLFIRDDPPKPDDYHWALYHHTCPSSGTKYHIRNIGAGGLSDHARHAIQGTRNSSPPLVGFFYIGNIPVEVEECVDTKLRTYDRELNEMVGTTCRTWLLRALELLKEFKDSDGKSILVGQDIGEIEKEAKAFANVCRFEAARMNSKERMLPVGQVSAFVAQR